jgi:hypothetical protein
MDQNYLGKRRKVTYFTEQLQAQKKEAQKLLIIQCKGYRKALKDGTLTSDHFHKIGELKGFIEGLNLSLRLYSFTHEVNVRASKGRH